VVHIDCSGTAFFTTSSRLPAAILSLHCTRVLLVGYRSSPAGRQWLPVAPCFISSVFQKLFSSISCFILMLQKDMMFHMLQWLNTYVSSVCST
jgi:hypothetical protein